MNLYEIWKSLAQQPNTKNEKKKHLQLSSPATPHLSFHRLWPWSFYSISWFLDLPAGSNWLQQNAGKFYNFLGFFMGVVEPLTPPKKFSITVMFGKQTHKHHHSTLAKSEFDSFNKNPIELARSPVTSSAASAGISASVAVVFAQEVLETETRGWYWDNVDARLGIGPFEKALQAALCCVNESWKHFPEGLLDLQAKITHLFSLVRKLMDTPF